MGESPLTTFRLQSGKSVRAKINLKEIIEFELTLLSGLVSAVFLIFNRVIGSGSG
jgi:hypothetical protein